MMSVISFLNQIIYIIDRQLPSLQDYISWGDFQNRIDTDGLEWGGGSSLFSLSLQDPSAVKV